MAIASREKTKNELDLAIKRLQKGMTKIVPSGTKLSIAGVAKEAGVSNATIHNRYPEVAEAIRSLLKASQIKNLQLKQEGLKGFSIKLSKARKEIETLKSDLQKTQSINLRLLKENELLKARASGS